MPYGHHLDLYGTPSIPEQIISLKRLNAQSYLKCTQAIVNSVECQSQISRSLIAQLSIDNFKISSSFPEISLGRTSGYLPHTKYCLNSKQFPHSSAHSIQWNWHFPSPDSSSILSPDSSIIIIYSRKSPQLLPAAAARIWYPPPPGIKSSVIWYPQVSNPQCFGTPWYKISGCTKSPWQRC